MFIAHSKSTHSTRPTLPSYHFLPFFFSLFLLSHREVTLFLPHTKSKETSATERTYRRAPVESKLTDIKNASQQAFPMMFQPEDAHSSSCQSVSKSIPQHDRSMLCSFQNIQKHRTHSQHSTYAAPRSGTCRRRYKNETLYHRYH